MRILEIYGNAHHELAPFSQLNVESESLAP